MISPVYCQASSPTPSVNSDGGALIPLRRDTNPVELTGVVPAPTGHSQMALAIGTFAKAVEASPPATFTPATSEQISVAFEPPFHTETGGRPYAAKPPPIGQPFR